MAEKETVADAEYKTTAVATGKEDEKVTKAVARADPAETVKKVGNILDLMDAKGFADICMKSGLFKDTTDMAKAIVKISFGRSLNIDEVTAMQSIIIVSGKMSFTSALIATRLKQSGKYRYEVMKKDDKECSIQFFEKIEDWKDDGRQVYKWVKAGPPEKYTIEMAKRAGLLRNETWMKFPEAMLFARCVTAGARTYTPDIFSGLPVYSAEELAPERATVNANGEVVVDVEDEPAVKVTKTKTTTARVDEPTPMKTTTPKPKPPPTLLAEVKGLVKELKVNEADYWGLYKVTGWEQMDTEQLADVKGKLEIRKRATPKGG